MSKKLGFLGFGLIFGFALSRVGASDFNLIYFMFTGVDLTLVGVIGTAIVIGALGMFVLRLRGAKTAGGQPITVKRKDLKRWSLLGALIFGLGWGLAGACPGTVLAQIGEGKWLGGFTVLGMIVGTYVYAHLKSANPDI